MNSKIIEEINSALADTEATADQKIVFDTEHPDGYVDRISSNSLLMITEGFSPSRKLKPRDLLGLRKSIIQNLKESPHIKMLVLSDMEDTSMFDAQFPDLVKYREYAVDGAIYMTDGLMQKLPFLTEKFKYTNDLYSVLCVILEEADASVGDYFTEKALDRTALMYLCLAWRGTSVDALDIIFEQVQRMQRVYNYGSESELEGLAASFHKHAQIHMKIWLESFKIDVKEGDITEIMTRFSREVFPWIAVSASGHRADSYFAVPKEVYDKIQEMIKGREGARDFTNIDLYSEAIHGVNAIQSKTKSNGDQDFSDQEQYETLLAWAQLAITRIRDLGLCKNCIKPGHAVSNCPEFDPFDARNNMAAYTMKNYEKVFKTTRPRKLARCASAINK